MRRASHVTLQCTTSPPAANDRSMLSGAADEKARQGRGERQAGDEDERGKKLQDRAAKIGAESA